jgi:hypothetical protein
VTRDAKEIVAEDAVVIVARDGKDDAESEGKIVVLTSRDMNNIETASAEGWDAASHEAERRGYNGHSVDTGHQNYGTSHYADGHHQVYNNKATYKGAGSHDFSVVKKVGTWNGIRKDGKAASLPPRLGSVPLASAVHPTGNYQKDIAASKFAAKQHAHNENLAYSQAIQANHLDAHKYHGDATADAKANAKWRNFVKVDTAQDRANVAAGINKIKQVDHHH